jgi:hypothetical protein
MSRFASQPGCCPTPMSSPRKSWGPRRCRGRPSFGRRWPSPRRRRGPRGSRTGPQRRPPPRSLVADPARRDQLGNRRDPGAAADPDSWAELRHPDARGRERPRHPCDQRREPACIALEQRQLRAAWQMGHANNVVGSGEPIRIPCRPIAIGRPPCALARRWPRPPRCCTPQRAPSPTPESTWSAPWEAMTLILRAPSAARCSIQWQARQSPKMGIVARGPDAARWGTAGLSEGHMRRAFINRLRGQRRPPAGSGPGS